MYLIQRLIFICLCLSYDKLCLGNYVNTTEKTYTEDDNYQNTTSNETAVKPFTNQYEGYPQYSSFENVHVNEPGPYGHPTPNYVCEKVPTTLYLTKLRWVIEKNCFKTFTVECKKTMIDGKDIENKKVCNEFTERKCRTVFETKLEHKCRTIFKKKCEIVHEEIDDTRYQQKCTIVYVKKCAKGEYGQTIYGYQAPPCKKVPTHQCKVVPVKVKRKVPRTKCRKIKSKHCEDHPVQVSKEECKDFPKEVCNENPVNVATKLEKKECKEVPKTMCNKVPRQVSEHIPKHVIKTVCKSTKIPDNAGSYESSDPHAEVPHDSPATYHDSLDSDHDSPTTYHDSPDTDHDSPATYHDSSATYHDSTDTDHDSPTTYHDSPATYHDSTDTDHDSPDTDHDSTDTYHDSPATYQDSSAADHDSPDTDLDSLDTDLDYLTGTDLNNPSEDLNVTPSHMQEGTDNVDNGLFPDMKLEIDGGLQPDFSQEDPYEKFIID